MDSPLDGYNAWRNAKIYFLRPRFENIPCSRHRQSSKTCSRRMFLRKSCIGPIKKRNHLLWKRIFLTKLHFESSSNLLGNVCYLSQPLRLKICDFSLINFWIELIRLILFEFLSLNLGKFSAIFGVKTGAITGCSIPTAVATSMSIDNWYLFMSNKISFKDSYLLSK